MSDETPVGTLAIDTYVILYALPDDTARLLSSEAAGGRLCVQQSPLTKPLQRVWVALLEGDALRRRQLLATGPARRGEPPPSPRSRH
jgi:hypothetical protein